jgi:hypothetical protein
MIPVPLLNPKFASVSAENSCELRVRGTGPAAGRAYQGIGKIRQDGGVMASMPRILDTDFARRLPYTGSDM